MRHLGGGSRLAAALASLTTLAACGGSTTDAANDAGLHEADASATDAAHQPPETVADGTAGDDATDTSATPGDADNADVDLWAGLDAGGYTSDAGSCGTGIVTFTLLPGPGGPWRASLSDDEEPNWLAVFTASGTPIYRDPSEATVDCDTCEGWLLPIGYSTGEVSDAGSKQTWDGLEYAPGATPTCTAMPPGPQNPANCTVQACAPPGEYVAVMCACGPDQDVQSGSFGRYPGYQYSVAGCTHPTCVRVPFLYPTPSDVTGTVTSVAPTGP